MERVERGEGTAADLLGDLLGGGLMPADCTPAVLGKELQAHREMLCDRDGILFSTRRTGKRGRVIELRKVSAHEF
jgi:hypothetical protein